MPNQLTTEDINQLLKALMYWDAEAQHDHFRSGLLKAMMSRSKEETMKAIENMTDPVTDSVRMEQVARLRVKLYDLRDELTNQEIKKMDPLEHYGGKL